MTAAARASACGGVPIDAAHLERQVPGLTGTGGHLAHYLEHGLARRLDPTPWFATDWYAWQNPDWHDRHAAPYLHYLDVGRHEGRDPSPLVDIVRYRQVAGEAVPAGHIYGLILHGRRSLALGVYEGWKAMRAAQSAFLGTISVFAHRIALPTRRHRALVVLQCGRGALTGTWYDDGAREWDLLVNYYDSAGFRPGLGDHVFFQKGTKFTAMWTLLNRYPEVFRAYDFVLFLDDDIACDVSDLNRLFATCREHALDLAQMSLTEGSACNWAELYARPGCACPRPVSAVEIMMPVLSRRALDWIRPTLGRSVSGFGLDLAWGRIVAGNGGRIAVLDQVSATHARPVDQACGGYYAYLRRHFINAKAELWATLAEYGADRDLVSLC